MFNIHWNVLTNWTHMDVSMEHTSLKPADTRNTTDKHAKLIN